MSFYNPRLGERVVDIQIPGRRGHSVRRVRRLPRVLAAAPMTSTGIYVAVALEADEDWPIADIVYDGTQWASATMRDGRLRVTVYGGTALAIPIEDAIASLQEAQQRLLDRGGPAPT